MHVSTWIPVILILAMGCASSGAHLTGNVVYRERIALAPDSVVRVVLEDVSRADVESTILAEAVIRTDGAQVPIPFSLTYDPDDVVSGRFGVRAEISDGAGALRWTTTAYHGVFAPDTDYGSDVTITVHQVALKPAAASAAQFECGGLARVSVNAGQATVHLAGKTRTLLRVRSASGEKYAGDNMVFWLRGDDARLEVGGREQKCVRRKLKR